ncbi:MAG: hypothetical protein CVV13_13485 [Gammaproteobacteria bacterium HGW-Gammaproteobacteria-3]|nr:MAG: hypothetical protein CVV13_13485 [Gammaproteobacteria bacterium HGW-Gammaproteobacteria-3]
MTSEAKQAGENAQKMVGKLTASLLAFSKEKPKVFYGALVGVVILFAIMIFSGGDSSPSVSGPAIKNLVIGQRYVLQSPNTTDKLATIRLVAVPGTIAAYDDTEEDDRTGGCKHMKQGTPVSVLGFQDAYGKQNAFVNVQIEQEGPCKGSSAWTLAINVQ